MPGIAQKICFILIGILIHKNCYSSDNQLVWKIDNMSNIGGNPVIVYGNPQIINSDGENVLEFNSTAITAPTTNKGDRIQIKANPLGSSISEFSIEMQFKPYATATDFAPRILHICRPDSMSGPRVMTMEIRSTSSWTTDFYIKSVTGGGIMGTTSYNTGSWMHMAMTYKNGLLKGYVNGMLDVSYNGSAFTGLPATTEVSLGGRMNNVNYFKGAIRKLIFTPIALEPAQFTMGTSVGTHITTENNDELFQNYPNPVISTSLIRFTLAKTEQVTLNIYNNSGQKIESLLNSVLQQGKNEIIFNRKNLPSGIYFYSISTSSGFKEIRKMHIQ